MRTLSSWMGRLLAGSVLALIVGVAPLAPAWAVAPLGACCLENGSCADLIDFQCEEQDGAFIGGGTACATVRCDAPRAAPVLSIVGTVAAIGALGALGVHRLRPGGASLAGAESALPAGRRREGQPSHTYSSQAAAGAVV